MEKRLSNDLRLRVPAVAQAHARQRVGIVMIGGLTSLSDSVRLDRNRSSVNATLDGTSPWAIEYQ